MFFIMNKHALNNFTLVEIALAMGVITVGLVSVLGLFPVGTNASRDAIGQTYASETADFFLQNLENQLRSDWSTRSKIPEEKYDRYESISWEKKYDKFWDKGKLGQSNIFKFQYGLLYRVKMSTEGINVTDFDGIVKIWREKVSVDGNPISYENAVALYCEVSWPAQAPYESKEREKETYYMELFRR